MNLAMVTPPQRPANRRNVLRIAGDLLEYLRASAARYDADFSRPRCNVPERDQSIAPMVRRTVYFSGDVQGVGFRYTTQGMARDFQVTGYVKNLPDGRVELVAEGEAGELGRFVARIGEVMSQHIRDAKAQDSPATGEFGRFGIAP